MLAKPKADKSRSVVDSKNFFISYFVADSSVNQANLGQNSSNPKERTMLTPPVPAPDFSLFDQNSNLFKLKDHLGKGVIVLFFYPKDDSFGCTAEACSFRDSYQDFSDAGALVIGISNDSVESHKGFAQKNRLPYTLLSDPDRVAEKAYAVDRSFFGLLKGRITYVIDREGVVREAFSSSVDFHGHVRRALQRVRELQAIS
jgi:peroxiredoxin Q/BCP